MCTHMYEYTYILLYGSYKIHTYMCIWFVQALTGSDEKERSLKDKSDVRLQWDPDHFPKGESHKRRAIQLGLRNKVHIIIIDIV